MKSIQSRISRGVALAISIYLLICGALFLHYIRYQSLREFDLTLESQMKAMISLVEIEGRKIDIDFFSDLMPEFLQQGHYFDFYLPDGTIIAQSPSSQGVSLPDIPEPGGSIRFLNWDSGDLGNVRVVQTSFEPRPEAVEPVEVMEPDPEPANSSVLVSPVAVYEIEYELPESVDAEELVLTIKVARDRMPLEQEMKKMTLLFIALAAILLAGIAVLTRLLVRHGLKSLRDLNVQIKEVEPAETDNGIRLVDAPEELAEIEHTVNSLLQRVKMTIAREKSFSTHVSHELRTPVAELKLIAEMGGSYPGDQEEVARYFSEVKEISTNMEVLVNRLLFLSRSTPGVSRESFESVDLNGFLETYLTNKTFADIDLYLDKVGVVTSDPELLKILFQNLFNNAISHGRPGSRVSCRLQKSASGICVQIENEVENLCEADLERISDPFWQKDESRTSSAHYGLGLSIVRNLEKVLGIEIVFSIREKKYFHAAVLFPDPA